MADDPIDTLSKAIESARNVRLGKGVTSKTSYIAAMPLAIMAMAVWRWSDNMTVNFGLIALCLAATLFSLWFIRSSRSFAQSNPALALLEGAELLEWRRMEVATRDRIATDDLPLIEDKGGQPPTIIG